MSEPMLEHTISLGAPDLPAALEAILLVADAPIAPTDLAVLMSLPEPEVLDALRQLAAGYVERGSGIEVREVAGGWRLYTNPACQDAVERYVRDGQQARLTHAALETLAIVAYRQPVSRARIAAIRGVNVDGVVRTLLQRGLIEEAGTDADGQSVLFRTSALFLERMGLKSLDELPEVAEHLPSIEALSDIDASL